MAQWQSYLPTNAGDTRDGGSIPGLGRSPGKGQGNSLHYSCLQNCMDRGAWRATQSLGLPRLSMHKETDVTTSHGAARKRVALIYLGLPASGHKNDTVAQKSKIRLIFLMWTACSQRRAK